MSATLQALRSGACRTTFVTSSDASSWQSRRRGSPSSSRRSASAWRAAAGAPWSRPSGMRSTGLGGPRVPTGGRSPDGCSRAQQPGHIAGTAPSPRETDDPQVGQSLGGIAGRLLRSAGPLLARAAIPYRCSRSRPLQPTLPQAHPSNSSTNTRRYAFRAKTPTPVNGLGSRRHPYDQEQPMKRLPRPHLSYANVVATLALVLAVGGTSYAASQINGKNLKNRSVAGKKLKKNTVTGTEVREAKLGKVPSATRADSAAQADNAATADTAAGSTTSANASKLGGATPESYRVSCPGGMIRALDECFEANLRAASTLPLALETCGKAGRRVPTFPELEAA